jgi:hypothetical protein
MISALKPFLSKKPFSWAIKTGYETVGNNGTPIRIFSWGSPVTGVKASITRKRKNNASILERFIVPPHVCPA